MSAAKLRIVWIDAAKGLSILLVVFHHAQIHGGSHEVALELYHVLSNAILPIRMPLFFAIAGVFAASSLKKRWSDLLQGRAMSCYYIYCLWSMLNWLYFATTNGTFSSETTLLPSFWIAPVNSMWFIWALAIYLPATKLLGYFNRAVVVCLLAAVSVLVLSGFEGPHWAVTKLLLNALFFMGGAWYGRAAVDGLTRHPKRVLTGAAAGYLLVGATFKLFEYMLVDGMLVAMCRLALSLLGVPLICAVVLFACRFGPFCRIMSFLGRNTLPIYVAHEMVLATLIDAFAAAPLPLLTVWAVPVAAVLAVVFSLGLANAAGSFGDRWLYTSEGLRAALAKRPRLRRSPWGRAKPPVRVAAGAPVSTEANEAQGFPTR